MTDYFFIYFQILIIKKTCISIMGFRQRNLKSTLGGGQKKKHQSFLPWISPQYHPYSNYSGYLSLPRYPMLAISLKDLPFLKCFINIKKIS